MYNIENEKKIKLSDIHIFKAIHMKLDVKVNKIYLYPTLEKRFFRLLGDW